MRSDDKKIDFEVFRRIKKVYVALKRKYTTKDRVIFITEDGIEVSVPKRILKSIAVKKEDGITISLERCV